MPTLVLSPRFGADAKYLLKMAQETEGWDVHRAVLYAPPETRAPSCVYGDLMFCDAMASRMGLGLLDPPDDWLSKLPERYLKREVLGGYFCDLVDLVKSRKFVKPANDKLFPAQVYERWEDVACAPYVSPMCPVLVSDIVSFDAEVRCYVLDRKVITASAYHVAGGIPRRFDVTKGASAWLSLMLKDRSVDMPSSVVIDVGLIHRRGWVVIEANQLYASGVYEEADGVAILPAILRASGSLADVRDDDRRFLR